MTTDLPVRPDRDVVAVRGADAGTFLHGQLSQDITGMADGEQRWSFLLQPTGKVHSWLRVTRLAPDQYELDVDALHGSEVVARLSRFKLRVDVDLALDLPRQCGTATELQRIRRGVPAMGAELTETVIPAELGGWIIDASASFAKGCYVGQELVARVDSRGSNTPRNLRRLRVSGPAGVGDEVLVAGEAVGTLTSVAQIPDDEGGGVAALAFIGRRISPETDAPVDATVAGAPALIELIEPIEVIEVIEPIEAPAD